MSDLRQCKAIRDEELVASDRESNTVNILEAISRYYWQDFIKTQNYIV